MVSKIKNERQAFKMLNSCNNKSKRKKLAINFETPSCFNSVYNSKTREREIEKKKQKHSIKLIQVAIANKYDITMSEKIV